MVSVLPLALGAAVSPTLLALQLVVLTGRTEPMARAWAVTAGAAVVLAGFSVLGLTVLVHLHPAKHGHHSVRDAVIMFVAAGLLAALAVRSLVKRPTSGEQQKSRTAGRLESAPIPGFVGVGALGMMVNFSTLVLFSAALHEITRSDEGPGGRAAALAVLFVITLLPVLAPVVLVSVAGQRAEPALDATHAFLGRHARQIGIVVEAVFAVYLVIRGFGELP